ncbi:HD-GYP domain-containing protein [Vibrio chagasii]|uniref:HD-GYP domain-containing protein n=1 Tax=Vibrio chagasii TaxID=170679 RepID=UPI0033771662|nr:hypothetical protein VCHA36P166_130053 [Vibrio chagasii]
MNDKAPFQPYLSKSYICTLESKLYGICKARIVTICDVFDALISKRPYKEPWPKGDAISFIKSQSGKMFDPELVSVFVQKQNDMYSFYQGKID